MARSQTGTVSTVRGVRHVATLVLARIKRSTEYATKTVRRLILYPLAWIGRRLHRKTVFIGITGSAGKTTTKDLCAAMLERFAACQSTPKSRNEHFDVAQTVKDVRHHHGFCVVELSASRPGYLDFSLQIVKPDIAVLTLVARDHFSAFKSVEAIAAEKGKVVASLPPQGAAVLNIDDPLVRKIGEACNRRVVWIGQGEGATLRLREARSNWPEPLTLVVEYQATIHEIATQLHGTQLALSVLAALGVALALDLPIATAIDALKCAAGGEGRMQIVAVEDGITFVRDDWKAPFWSLQAPFDFMIHANARRKVLIIGTLSDYSLSASKVYPKVAKRALEVGDLIVFVGPHAMRALKAGVSRGGQELLAFPSIREASTYLKSALRTGDLVLLKGSNKADHLVRLVLDRSAPISCWEEKCALQVFCGSCSRLYKVPAPSTVERTFDAPEPEAGHARADAHVISSISTEGPHVVVGLGNPGQQYINTPHNVGHRVLESVAEAAGGAWEEHPEGVVAFVRPQDVQVALLKPSVSMNQSGHLVRRFLDRMGGNANHCLVVHDDMDLALGDVRLKRSGGDAGHKGVQSVIAALGSGGFERVRVGVRRGGDTRRARELVLEPFSEAETSAVGDSISWAASLVIERILYTAYNKRTETALEDAKP